MKHKFCYRNRSSNSELLFRKQKFKYRTSVSEAEIENGILFPGGTSSYDRSFLLVSELFWQLLTLNFCFRNRNFNLKSVSRRDLVFYQKFCALNRISLATFNPELLLREQKFQTSQPRFLTRTKK